MTSNVRDIDTDQFDTEVVQRSHQVPVVVDFWAAWCGPCRVLGPTLEKLATEAGGDWELVKVDVDRNQALSGQFGVQGIPTVIGFRDGQPVARFTGALPEAQVRTWLGDLVPSERDLAVEQGRLQREAGNVDAAESAFRAVLEQDPAHAGAATALAEVLVDTDRTSEALEILARLAPTDEVSLLQTRARLAAGSGDLDALRAAAADESDLQAGLAYGRALAAAGRHADAMEVLLPVAAARQDDLSDQARLAMLDLFETSDDQALVAEYRKRLANALF